MGLVTLTLNLLCKSHLRQETFLPNMGMLGQALGSKIICYVRDGWGDKSNA